MSDVDHVVPLDIGCVPEAAVSGATLLGDEYLTYLLFNAMCARPNGTREAAGLAVVKFDSCSVTKFGYPNDEALPGHPLYANGLSYYGVYEVLRSRWVAEKTRQNRVSFPPTPDDMTRRHFIFTFHDSTFECLANGMEVRVTTEPWLQVVGAIVEELARH